MLRIAETKDIPEGKSKLVTLPNGEEVAIFHQEGKFYALSNACPHMGGPLNEGELEDNCITCPWHGWQFDLITGACVHGGGEDAKAFSLIIENETIYLNTTASPEVKA